MQDILQPSQNNLYEGTTPENAEDPFEDAVRIIEGFIKRRCSNLDPSAKSQAYKLRCDRQSWFQDDLSVANNHVFMARDDLEALHKIRQYMLSHGRWLQVGAFSKAAGDPLDLFKYAMKCPQWSYYQSICGKELEDPDDQSDTFDDAADNSNEEEIDTGKSIMSMFTDALMGFYGLGRYASIRDCALKIEKLQIET